MTPIGEALSEPLRSLRDDDRVEGGSKSCGDGIAPDGRKESDGCFDMIP